METLVTLINAVGVAVLILSSVYGMIQLFKRKVPMYFQLTVCAVWCYSVQTIYSILITLCAKNYRDFSDLSFLGTAAMFMFLASSNFGQFNTLVDEGGKRLRKIRLAALAAPILAAAYYVFICVCYEWQNVWFAISFAVVMIPLAISSYYNVKFTLMKDDGTGFIRGAKPVNIASLVTAVCYLLYVYAGYAGTAIFETLTSFVAALAISSIVFFADWGRKQWHK